MPAGRASFSTSTKRRRWADAAERLVKTLLQAFAGAVVGFGLDDWHGAAKAGTVAAAISLLTSISSWSLGNGETSSALPAELDPATPPGQGP